MSNVISDFVGLFRNKQIISNPKDNDFLLVGQTGVGNIHSTTQASMRTRLVRVRDITGGSSLITVPAVGTTFTANLSLADYFSITLPDGAGPYTINFTGLSIGTNIVYIKQNTTANGVATLTGVEWPAGAAPAITLTANKIDIVTLVYDGTTIRGVITQDYV